MALTRTGGSAATKMMLDRLARRRLSAASVIPQGMPAVAAPSSTPAAPAAPSAPGVQQALAAANAPAAPAAPAAQGGALPSYDPSKTAPAATKYGSYTPGSQASSFAGGGAPDPRDATYWQDVGRLVAERDTGLAGLSVQESQGAVARNRALYDLGTGHDKNVMAIRQGSNKAGLFYSSTHGRSLGDEATAYAMGIARTEEDWTNVQNALAVQERAILSGYTVQEAAALGAATYRAAQRAAEAAATAVDAPPPAAAAPPPSAAPGIAGKTDQRATGPPPGKDYYWTGTRWVPIGKSVAASHGNYASGPPPSKNHAWDGRRWVKVR